MQENLVRTVLKNEFTWIVIIITAVWTCVSTIIIPLNTIQNTQSNILVTLAEIKTSNTDFNVRISANSEAIAVMEEKIKSLSKLK